MHIGVFDVLNKVLFQKLTGDVSKKYYFYTGFFRFFAFAFFFFLCWPFLLLFLNFCVFFLPLLLLLFHKSSCYVLVSVFCCFGFPGFACVLCVVFFWFVFGFFFLEGLRVR